MQPVAPGGPANADAEIEEQDNIGDGIQKIFILIFVLGTCYTLYKGYSISSQLEEKRIWKLRENRFACNAYEMSKEMADFEVTHAEKMSKDADSLYESFDEQFSACRRNKNKSDDCTPLRRLRKEAFATKHAASLLHSAAKAKHQYVLSTRHNWCKKQHKRGR
ncbi:MAG: hypothetical protein H0W88_02185 [Parachlamydiaceae bacterium]|nr:hypothetical protein [Parachlamydiaceae bacterium]